jgi:signal transduction histidine kinase
MRRSSIATRLTGINTLVSGAALLLACVAFATYDQATFREGVVRNLSTKAQIVGANSISALVFNDPQAAENTLAALSAAPHIVSAEIYTPDGQPFAAYYRDDRQANTAMTIPAGRVEISRFDDRHVVLARRISVEEKQAGSVSIRSDLSELIARRAQYVRIGAAVLMASLVAAGFLSWISQRAISRPIVSLAETARRVSSEKDYSVRAAASGKAHEIAVLVDAFNDMLTQIQQRDQALHEVHVQLEDRVRQRTSELDAVNGELEAFTYSVSHDLRAPLRHVTGFAGLLEEHAKGQLDEQSHKYLRTIAEAARKMGQLIDDLLAFSRMGRSPLVKQPLSLNNLVREAREEVTSQSGKGSHDDIKWKLHDLPEVDADPAMLRQVMVNLLSNALKYSSSQPAPSIEVGMNRGAPGETVVFVRDNGVGFDMQFAHKLFGVFQRLHSSDEFEGTGIGLANVKRIIQRHGGRVWSESRIDCGATFYFSLPTNLPTTGAHV